MLVPNKPVAVADEPEQQDSAQKEPGFGDVLKPMHRPALALLIEGRERTNVTPASSLVTLTMRDLRAWDAVPQAEYRKQATG